MLVIEKDYAASQIIGARAYQEDTQDFALLGEVENLLTVLADGMGGENAGDYASESVVDTFLDYCSEISFEKAESNIPSMLRSAMLAANEGLVHAVEKDPTLAGMGCTLLACVVCDNRLYWVSVGDSPLYLYRRGSFSQINEDHSMLPVLKELVAEGRIHPSALIYHPDRHLLRSAITGDEIELIDCPDDGLSLEPGDIILVASDGIQTLTEESICEQLKKHHKLTAGSIAKKLLTAVENVGKFRQDNTSINVIHIREEENDLPNQNENIAKPQLSRGK